MSGTNNNVVMESNQVTSKESHELEGLSDGGHNLIPCSNCRAILMDVWVTRPHETNTWKVQAVGCPFCGDDSFVVKINGGFHYGGYGAQKGNDVEESVESTAVGDSEIENGIFKFQIVKASKDAKPLYR